MMIADFILGAGIGVVIGSLFTCRLLFKEFLQSLITQAGYRQACYPTICK